ncbi:hypothetical protein EJB05_02494, partial [Eragrostis curvula]
MANISTTQFQHLYRRRFVETSELGAGGGNDPGTHAGLKLKSRTDQFLQSSLSSSVVVTIPQ